MCQATYDLTNLVGSAALAAVPNQKSVLRLGPLVWEAHQIAALQVLYQQFSHYLFYYAEAYRTSM